MVGKCAGEAEAVLVRLWDGKLTYGDAAPRPLGMVKRLRKDRAERGTQRRREG